MKLKNIVASCWFFGGLCSAGLSFAEWVGPKDIIVSPWGQSNNAFGIKYGDVSDFDELPGNFDISDFGDFVMADEINGRFKIYDATGNLKALVTPPVDDPERWTIAPHFIGRNISLILDKLYIYNLSADLINERPSPKKARFRKDVDGVLYIYQTNPINKWASYSSQGDPLNIYDVTPLVIGRIFHDSIVYNEKKSVVLR